MIDLGDGKISTGKMGLNDHICNYSFAGKEFNVDADKCEIIQSNIYTNDFTEVKDCCEG